MKAILLLLITIIPIQLNAQSVNCENAPKESTTVLPSPIDRWAVIFCSPKGHVLAAIDGNLWLAPNGKPFMFQSNSKPAKENAQHSSYFTGIAHTKLDGQQKTNTNKMLAMATKNEDQSLQPWQLDVKSNMGVKYNIFFFEKDGIISFVLGCVDQCQQSVLLTNKTLEQLKNELDKNA